jgi:hypothetical protein
MMSPALLGDARQPLAAEAITRGARRVLRSLGCPSVTELVLADGRRADIVAMAPNGQITIVEVKSSLQDYYADKKWAFYRDYCDLLYFAVAPDGPVDAMPTDEGLIVADAHGGLIVREARLIKANPARRRTVLLGFARCAAMRLHNAQDPGAACPE